MIKRIALIPVRFLAALVSFPLCWLGIVWVIAVFAWWMLAGALLAPFGPLVRRLVCRYIGAYPFTFSLVGLFWIAAIFHWAAVGANPVLAVARMCEQTLHRIDETNFGPIGGFWG